MNKIEPVPVSIAAGELMFRRRRSFLTALASVPLLGAVVPKTAPASEVRPPYCGTEEPIYVKMAEAYDGLLCYFFDGEYVEDEVFIGGTYIIPEGAKDICLRRKKT